MRYRFAVPIIVLMFLMSRHALATDKNNHYADLGSGNSSCGSYAASRKGSADTNELAFIAWLAGWLTSSNVGMSDTYDLLGETDMDGALGWLDNYCASHPTEKFAHAADELTTFLYPKRKRSAPK